MKTEPLAKQRLFRAKKRIEALTAALKEAREVLMLSDPNGDRADGIRAPEDKLIRNLCESIGYGAVMDSAARQWRVKDAVGAHTTGACAGTVRDTIALIDKALRR